MKDDLREKVEGELYREGSIPHSRRGIVTDSILSLVAEDRRACSDGDVIRTASEWRDFLHTHGESEWDGGLLQETLIDDVEIYEARLAECAEDRRELVEAILKPEQLEQLADWMLMHGDIDKDSVCLTAQILRNKAEATRAALRKEGA